MNDLPEGGSLHFVLGTKKVGEKKENLGRFHVLSLNEVGEGVRTVLY